MVRLPTDALPAAEFLVRHLYRPIDVSSGARYFAVAETERVGDDAWFWNDDNAKSLEMMSRPEVWRRFPHETYEILRFVRSMCRGPFVFRRVSVPRLDALGMVEGAAAFRHSLMSLRQDPASGAVAVGVRFHDERNSDGLLLDGNYVEFRHRGRRIRRPVPAGRTQVERDGSVLRLRHTADVDLGGAWRRRRVGEISHTYTFDAASMVFSAEAAFEIEPGTVISDVVLTIGHGGLDRCVFNTVVGDGAGDGKKLFSAGRPRSRIVDAAGNSYYAIRQGHSSGDALALHSMPCEGARLAGIEAVVEIQGRLDRVMARYEFPGIHGGARLVAAERKLLTAGGFYDRVGDYAGLLREAAGERGSQAAYDFSISYDYGVTLNALAKCFAVASLGEAPVDPRVSPDELRAAFDELAIHYFKLYVARHEDQPNAIFSRELAFAMLGVTTMYRATGCDDYRQWLARMRDVLLDFEIRFADRTGTAASGFLMRKDSPRRAFVDCHSAALLALTQAARFASSERLVAAIAGGIRSYGLETCRVGGALVDTIQTLMADEHGVWSTENAFWNFKAGLTLRFFNALRAATETGLRAIAEANGERMDLLETVIRRQLERCLMPYPDGLEIRCSVTSGETNSESQPWAMLGLVGHPCD